MIDWLTFFPSYPGKCLDRPLRCKNAHQLIIKTQEELARACVTLSAGSAAELIIDTPGLVTLGPKDMQPTDFSHAGAEFYIRATPCHIGCNCYIASHLAVSASVLVAGLGNNRSFSLVLFCIQNLVLIFFAVSLLKGPGQGLIFFNAHRTHKHRSTGTTNVIYLFHYRIKLLAHRFIDYIIHVFPDARLVGRYHNDFKVVNIHKLFSLGRSGAGHSSYLLIEFEEILQGDSSKCLRFFFYGDSFFCFDCLVQSI